MKNQRRPEKPRRYTREEWKFRTYHATCRLSSLLGALPWLLGLPLLSLMAARPRRTP